MAHHARVFASALCLVLWLANVTAQHVLLPFSQHDDRTVPKLAARGTEQISLESSDYAYVVDATVGTPGQKLSLLISSSSADTWVPDANTRYCSPDWYYSTSSSRIGRISYCRWGSFNKSNSETYLPANSRFSSFSDRYIDGTSVMGENMTDKFILGNVEVDDYPMGLVSSTDRWIGVLGLGFPDSSYYSSSSSGSYEHILDRMVSSGKIASSAYSLWLDNPQGTSGGLLFGAVDTSRFTGDLLEMPNDAGYSSAYSHAWAHAWATKISSINATTADGTAMPAIRSNDFPLDVTIGPGEVFSYLPTTFVEKVAEMAGATFSNTLSLFTIPCDAAKTNNTKFVFELGRTGGPKLNVETADLIVSPSVLGYYYETSDALNGTGVCLFGVQSWSYSSDSSSSSLSSYYYNIGSSLLRRSYLVFDFANSMIGVAAVKFPSGSEKPTPTIVAFASSSASIPSATMFCTNSRCSLNTDGSDDSSGSGSGSGYGYNWTESGPDHWKKVAIALGVTFGILLLVGLVAAVFVWNRECRGARKAMKEADEEESQTPPPEMAQDLAAQTGGLRAPGVSPPGPLPVIQEDAPETNAHTPAHAPQLPLFGTQVARSTTPLESEPNNRASAAVPGTPEVAKRQGE
ncbi:hypothetical protein N0V88_005206 [Collariella sp. IMI 366227]|nr:hypothetical protein N0V88_005206 [Collariella sp. IMI 366227]